MIKELGGNGNYQDYLKYEATVPEPPELTRGFLHCYYKDICGIRPVERELQNTVVWLSFGFDRSLSRDGVDRFLTDLEHVVDDVFTHLVKQAARHGLLNLTYCIDSTDVRAISAVPDTSKCFDTTAGEYDHGYRSTLNRIKDPDSSGVHRE